MIPWLCRCKTRGESATEADAFRDWRVHGNINRCTHLTAEQLADAVGSPDAH